MNNTKLQVLKDFLAYVIKHKEEHDWGNPAQCHCGMLLKSSNLYKEEVIEHAAEDAGYLGYYKDIFNMYINPTCEITNLPFTQILNQLINSGFSLDELIKLEYLEDERFRDVNTSFYVKHRNVDSLIQYLNNWISYEEQVAVKVTNKQTVTVSI